MSPRKSTSRASRPSVKTQDGSAGESSKSVLPEIPSAEMPSSITPEYEPSGRGRMELDEEGREAFLHDLVCFHPREVCDQFTQSVLHVPTIITDAIQSWAEDKYRKRGDDTGELEREMNKGLVAIETLLESHVDRAMDKFTAWALRNTFDIPPNLEVVLPWQQGLDFERAAYVESLPEGLQSLTQALEEERTKVEQARLLTQRLILAEQALDKRLEIANQRRAEVGFVKEVLSSSGLSPLPEKTESIVSDLSSLHSTLEPLSDVPLSSSVPSNTSVRGGENTKAWQMGRQAYLNWAVGKVLSESSRSNTLTGGGGVGGGNLGVSTSSMKNGPGAGSGSGRGGGDDGALKDIEGMMKFSAQEGLEKLNRSME